jgi:hypothetical protein
LGCVSLMLVTNVIKKEVTVSATTRGNFIVTRDVPDVISELVNVSPTAAENFIVTTSERKV